MAYEAAGDQDAVVRLNLDKLKSPHKAASMVRKGGSREGAQRLAQYCSATRDYQVRLPLSILAPCLRPGVSRPAQSKAVCQYANVRQQGYCSEFGCLSVMFTHTGMTGLEGWNLHWVDRSRRLGHGTNGKHLGHAMSHCARPSCACRRVSQSDCRYGTAALF